ncbi:MAG: isocitrate/isopropylmalate dehydrogenase family protein [Proteobacteria bacterium]|nr:isocitrate/isopropylmalate dehydrogenase family protein [Pseudomonadota bacterium]
MKIWQIAVLEGDGVGREVMPVCLELLNAVANKVGTFQFQFKHLEAGADLFQRTGEAFPDATFQEAKSADAILLGAMGIPEVRYPDGREIAPQLDLRERLGLFAGLRPIRSVQGVPEVLSHPLASKIDFVIIRESTEGLFAARNSGENNSNDVAKDSLVITRAACERLFHYAFRLARKRSRRGYPGKVTCVDKANVLSSYAFFRKIFKEIAEEYPDVKADYCYIDAMALNLVKIPWEFDVLVAENMFGDILSDLGAALIGGMGMAPSGDIGENHAVFQPCHGTAPDIIGKGMANPVAMLRSAAMMVEWLGEKAGIPEAHQASRFIQLGIDKAFEGGELLPYELGGTAGTREIFDAIMEQLEESKDVSDRSSRNGVFCS